MSYQQAWGPYCEFFGGELSPYVHSAGERMQDKVIELLNHYEPKPRTIIHGDYRLDNLFFDHEDGSPVAAIDWQISSKGRGIFDVAYFIISSLEPDARKANEMRLLQSWHDVVVDAGAKGYSFDEALYDYRKAILYCNVYTVIAVGSMDAANERGVALQKAWIRRRGAAMEHLDCAECMPK
jgi:aminoglycoside phosphotransferase (APT) family kinase protein